MTLGLGMTVAVERSKSFSVGDWLADPARDVVARGDEQVKLEPKAMEVLVFLARRQGEVVPQRDLEDQVWRGLVVTSQSVYQSIAQLRRALGDNPRAPQFIETVPRRGYRLVAPVEWRDATPAPAPAATPAPRGSRWSSWLIAASLMMLGVGLLGWHAWRQPPTHRSESIAVLGFDDLSPDHSQAYLAVVLVEELTNALGQVDGLMVAARNSARIAGNGGAKLADIASQLGVNHVVQGSVRRVGDRIRVVATLVDARTGYEKWSRTFERPAAAIAQLPADIAGAVAGAIGYALVGDPGVRGSRVGTRSPTAYDFYMLGQQRFNERTPFALSEAERYFQQAAEADPGFAAAYAALADVHIAEYYFAGRQLSETVDLVLPLAGKALEIDPDFGVAHAMRGWTAMESGAYAEATADFERAIALSPNDAKAHHWLGIALLAQARPRDASIALDRALALDPLNFIIHIRRALALDALGQYDAAEEAATRAMTLAPKHPNPRWTLGLIATSQGNLAQAIVHYKEALALDPSRSDLRVQLATLELDAGHEPEAHRQLAEAAKLAQGSHAYLTARAYEALLAQDTRGLAGVAESIASIDPRNRFLMMDAANFSSLAGHHEQALELFRRTLAKDPEARLNDLWMIRWGLESAATSLAASHAALGQPQERDRVLQQFSRFLDEAETRGIRYWGLHYQRAASAALRGDTVMALAHLEKAAATGWRRTWWARTDPALATLHARPEFNLLLDRIDGANGTRR